MCDEMPQHARSPWSYASALYGIQFSSTTARCIESLYAQILLHALDVFDAFLPHDLEHDEPFANACRRNWSFSVNRQCAKRVAQGGVRHAMGRATSALYRAIIAPLSRDSRNARDAIHDLNHARTPILTMTFLKTPCAYSSRILMRNRISWEHSAQHTIRTIPTT